MFCGFMFLLLILIESKLHAAPSPASKSWPPMKNYDIWGQSGVKKPASNRIIMQKLDQIEKINGGVDDNRIFGAINNKTRRSRNGKVLNFFPIETDDDDCVSEDGLRTGVCMNTYECRMQGGSSKGTCALGFGVCCIFTVTCEEEIALNHTYFVSPRFPGLMPGDMESCRLKIKTVGDDISQLRLDFVHFTIGQPNRRTGICDGDIFSLAGGLHPFSICGQNSGQHVYYDLDMKGRADNLIELTMNFSKRAMRMRLWEIKITQIPFSLKSPSGCSQFFTGNEGVIQTFNFAENGRHLSNQHYRACVRQEIEMCSIQYEPCDEQSFRIGSGPPSTGGTGTNIPGSNTGLPGTINAAPLEGATLAEGAAGILGDAPVDPITGAEGDPVAADEPALGDPVEEEPLADEPAADDPDTEEGSGGGGFFDGFNSFFSREALFDPFIFRSFSSPFSSFTPQFPRSRRQSRQLYSTCRDRITMPCIIEDFIGVGMGEVPSCLPVHCGLSLCGQGVSPCRLETSVTPFGIGIHFGDGYDKGNPEDNLGVCLRYKQLPCTG